METLAVCAKVLYDNDMLDKQAELDRYKKDMMPPILYFNSEEDMYTKKDELLINLEKSIVDWFNNHFSWSLTYSYGGLSSELMDYSNTTYFQSDLYNNVFNVLQEFFGDTNWLSNVVNMMCIGLQATLTSIARVCAREYDVLHRNNICRIIEASIKEQLDSLVFNDYQDQFFRFRCHTCLKYASWRNITNNTCIECNQK